MSEKKLTILVNKLLKCSECPEMIGPVVSGYPVMSPVMLIGQAPGPKEGEFGRPFSWTAGRTMWKWFASIGLEEEEFRKKVYMAAVCRCFPGKNPKGGDRVPDKQEIANCRNWMDKELDLVQPKLLIPVGKLAIQQFMPADKLKEVVGKKHQIEVKGRTCDVIPLPHPSGASTWHRMEPGITLLKKSLKILKNHPAWKEIAC